jgi:hypothetical protein
MILLRACLCAIAIAAVCMPADAQTAGAPTRAFAFGWSPAAGLLGVEFVDRSFTRMPRLGGAVGIGLAGVGARLNVTIRDPAATRHVPYLGVGYVATPWLPIIRMSGAASVEGGVQVWPSRRDDLYFDFGAGIAFITGASSSTAPGLRLLVGHPF